MLEKLRRSMDAFSKTLYRLLSVSCGSIHPPAEAAYREAQETRIALCVKELAQLARDKVESESCGPECWVNMIWFACWMLMILACPDTALREGR
ncbi:hypothetical protein LA080_008064 [Diaporthe eres]|nr:hypothetical protein LA080_008064 [Diaporthe eres]